MLVNWSSVTGPVNFRLTSSIELDRGAQCAVWVWLLAVRAVTHHASHSGQRKSSSRILQLGPSGLGQTDSRAKPRQPAGRQPASGGRMTGPAGAASHWHSGCFLDGEGPWRCHTLRTFPSCWPGARQSIVKASTIQTQRAETKPNLSQNHICGLTHNAIAQSRKTEHAIPVSVGCTDDIYEPITMF